MKAAAWTFSGRAGSPGRAASGLAGRVLDRFGRRRSRRSPARLGRLPGPAAPGPRPATCRPRPPESFRAWWKRTRRRPTDDRERPRRDPGPGPRARSPASSPAGAACPRLRDRAGPVDDLVDLFVERVADYRAVVEPLRARRASRRPIAAALAGGARSSYRPGCGLPRRRRRRRRRHSRPPSSTASTRSSPRPASASPRPAPSCSTTRPDQGRRAITLVPDLHVCVVRADQVVADVPDAVARARPGPAADLDQRPVAPPATSSSTGSRASTARAPCTSWCVGGRDAARRTPPLTAGPLSRRPVTSVVVGAGPAGSAAALGALRRGSVVAGAAAGPQRLPPGQVLRRRHRAPRARRARHGRSRRRGGRLDAAAPPRALAPGTCASRPDGPGRARGAPRGAGRPARRARLRGGCHPAAGPPGASPPRPPPLGRGVVVAATAPTRSFASTCWDVGPTRARSPSAARPHHADLRAPVYRYGDRHQPSVTPGPSTAATAS